MIDVHPPHHAAATRREFFTHIATIVIGLLIAIGLEQSVEALHHHHQRHQFEADLRAEGVRNRQTQPREMRVPDTDPVIKLRFSCGLGIPTLAVFAGQILIGIRQVGDLLGRAVVEQFFARPQCDRIQVHGL